MPDAICDYSLCAPHVWVLRKFFRLYLHTGSQERKKKCYILAFPMWFLSFNWKPKKPQHFHQLAIWSFHFKSSQRKQIRTCHAHARVGEAFSLKPVKWKQIMHKAKNPTCLYSRQEIFNMVKHERRSYPMMIVLNHSTRSMTRWRGFKWRSLRNASGNM